MTDQFNLVCNTIVNIIYQYYFEFLFCFVSSIIILMYRKLPYFDKYQHVNNLYVITNNNYIMMMKTMIMIAIITIIVIR